MFAYLLETCLNKMWLITEKKLFSTLRQNQINFCSIGIPQNKKKEENLPAKKTLKNFYFIMFEEIVIFL